VPSKLRCFGRIVNLVSYVDCILASPAKHFDEIFRSSSDSTDHDSGDSDNVDSDKKAIDTNDSDDSDDANSDMEAIGTKGISGSGNSGDGIDSGNGSDSGAGGGSDSDSGSDSSSDHVLKSKPRHHHHHPPGFRSLVRWACKYHGYTGEYVRKTIDLHTTAGYALLAHPEWTVIEADYQRLVTMQLDMFPSE
jgi:hypothetical protein